MPTSNPKIKKAQDHQQKKVAAAADFKKAGAKKKVELELPSGNVVIVKRIPITKLLEMDIFPDSMEAVIAEKLGSDAEAGPGNAAKPIDPKEVQKKTLDPAELTGLMRSVDRITAASMLEPAAELHLVNTAPAGKPEVWEEIPEDERDDELLYTDEIAVEDKFFLFQFTVGGSSDLDAFRAEFGSALGALENGNGVPDAAK